MKKFLALALSLVMVLALAVGCGKTDEPATTPDDAAKTDAPLKVALLLPGNINDAGWNATAYEGLMLVKEENGVEVNYSESVPQSNYEEVFRNYATEGDNVIFGHGYEFTDAAKVVAKEFPDVKFIMTSTDAFEAPNVASVNTLNAEMGLMQGTAAAYATKSGIIGAIGGMAIPPITDPVNCTAAAALMAKPELKILTNMTGNNDDASKVKETALAMIDQGADVIMYSANAAGMGALEACKERGVLAIPSISDQKDLAPEIVLMSGISDVKSAMSKVVSYIIDGSFQPQFYSMGVSTGCVGYAPNDAVWDKAMSDEGKAAVEDIYQQLKASKLDAYKVMEEYLPAELKVG